MIIDQPTGVSHECSEEEKQEKLAHLGFYFNSGKISLLQSERARERERVIITGDVDCMGGSEILWPPGTSTQLVSTISPPSHHHHLTSPRTPRHSGLHNTRLGSTDYLETLASLQQHHSHHYDTLLGYINITATTTA